MIDSEMKDIHRRLTIDRVCPWWLIRTFDNPLRHLIHNPERILAGLVDRGDRVADIGCGMGYFTKALAQMVGLNGRVIAVDLQPQMLAGLRRRLKKANLLDRVDLLLARSEGLGLEGDLDFALAFWMIHEVPDSHMMLGELFAHLRPTANLLIVEPRVHVSQSAFARTLSIAKQIGFNFTSEPRVAFSRSAKLCKSLA
jgi:ubiquinone/menaquinone biosynthesis C-methylase UbiE